MTTQPEQSYCQRHPYGGDIIGEDGLCSVCHAKADRARQRQERQTVAEQSNSRRARDWRALAVAELLRSGWTAREVSAGLKIIDAGGGVMLAMSVMRETREARRK
jgi:hypothetical protein